MVGGEGEGVEEGDEGLLLAGLWGIIVFAGVSDDVEVY